nr:AMP-binding protein [Erythrobacter sp.]
MVSRIAQISTTSGTTGQPKAIAISRAAISDTVSRLVTEMEIDSGIREYIGVPVTFSFGLGRARAIAAVGGTAFLPETGFRPDEIARMLNSGAINALSAVPTMLRTIFASPDVLGSAGKRLKWLEIGSQFMSADEKRMVRKLFPSAIILQHYGLTEASRSTFLRVDQADDYAFESVGRAVGTSKVRISREGLIEISGDHLASGIIQNGLIRPLAGDDGWLTTSDLGEIRDGWLHYMGRTDDVANIGGIKVSAEVVERLLAAALGTQEIGVAILRDELRGEKLGIALPSGSSAADKRRVHAVAEGCGLSSADLMLAEISDLPRTPTGKLQRKALSQALEGIKVEQKTQAGSWRAADLPLSGRESEIASIWSEALGISDIGKDDSFYDLGGDSLSAVSVLIRAEQVGLPKEVMQRMFAGETIGQIAQALEENSQKVSINIRGIRADGLNAARGILALLIVVSHWGPFFIDRMGSFGSLLWSFLGPALRIGTPGFAMVFGAGLAFFYVSQLERSGKQIARRIRLNTTIVVSGVLLIGGAQAWSISATGGEFGPNWPERLFYEVLLFYALMLPSSVIWLRLVGQAQDRITTSLLLAGFAYSVTLMLQWAVPENPFSGWGSLAWHMAVAPYAYPRLLGAVALGLAAGLWLEKQSSGDALVRNAERLGSVLAAGGFLLVASLQGGWQENAEELVAVPAFAGAVLLLFAMMTRLAAGSGSWPRRLRPAIIAGMLAFPIFIGHGLVGLVMSILIAYSVPYILALFIPAILFVAAMLMLGWRIHRMIYPGHM